MHGLHPEVLVLRRGDIDQIERPLRSSQVLESVAMPNVGAVRETGGRKIPLDGGDRLVAAIDEGAGRGALAQRLDTDAPASREEIEHVHARNSWTKDVEEGGLDAIEDRARAMTWNKEQLLPPGRPRNHAH